MQDKVIILSTAYFAPVQMYSKLLIGSTQIEAHENFSRKSYRNRCEIYGANGIIALSVPIEKSLSQKTLIKDVKIAYDEEWQRLHFMSIKSAYNSSPFYEYYIDDLNRFFNKKFDYLFDLNLDIFLTIKNLIGIDKVVSVTENYVNEYPEGTDFRYNIHPKEKMQEPDNQFAPVDYYQVFALSHGFKPNLSILDLLFNEGPASIQILESCITHE